jgi:soluble lytic murein transglycosylase
VTFLRYLPIQINQNHNGHGHELKAIFTKGRFMRYVTVKPVALAVSVASLLYLCAFTSPAADSLDQAAALFRDKDYASAYSMAKKSGDSAQRTFMMGVAALKQGKADEAVVLLGEAEQKLPLLADYAAFFQAEALMKLKKFPDAAGKAASIAKAYPSSLLVRRSDKLTADIFYEAGEYANALKGYQGFVEKYPAGSDSVEALYQSALCRELTGDKDGSAPVYRNIWLNNPSSAQSRKSQDRLKELEKSDVKPPVYSAEELLRRASTLFTQGEFNSSLKTLQSIPLDGQPPAVISRIDLRTGMAQYRLRNWKLAEKSLKKATASTLHGIASEARFWLARALERQDQHEQAAALYLELAEEGKKQEFSDEALMEVAGLRRSLGSYGEAAKLFERIVAGRADSRFVARATWEAAWCRYLAGEYGVAAESFRKILKDDAVREKALYWLARSLERTGSAESGSFYRMLLDEYPAGFYASWYRGQNGIADVREALGQRNALAELPQIPGFEKPRLLASLGMIEDGRAEMSAARKKAGENKSLFPGLARIYMEMEDYSSSISLFLANRPVKWDKVNLPLWAAGYPLAYSASISQHTTANSISEGLVYALMRAESGFSPAIKSPAGAIGLMQLMPATAKATAREKGSFDPLRLTVPDYNIKLGTRHFRDLMKEYSGDVIYSIAAYNAGAAAVERWRKNLKGLAKDEFIESIPYQETRDYVKKVYASAATYRQLYGLK